MTGPRSANSHGIPTSSSMRSPMAVGRTIIPIAPTTSPNATPLRTLTVAIVALCDLGRGIGANMWR